MSKHEPIAASCEGKDRMSRDRAQALARRQRKKGLRVEAYKCDHCAKWHIGSRTEKKANHEHSRSWTPRPDRDRPTQERRERGQWVWVTTDMAGIMAVQDVNSHQIDRLENDGVISSDQASAARDFEALYRAQIEIMGARDSCTIWEPRGFQSDDGPVEARERYRELCRTLGMQRESRLTWACVHERPVRPRDVGQLREDLNECARFFKRC